MPPVLGNWSTCTVRAETPSGPSRWDGTGSIDSARFAPKRAPAIRRVLALASLSSGEEGIDEAIANFQASITDKTPAPESLDSLARLIRLLGIRRNEPDKSPELLKRVHDVAVNAKPPLTQDAKAKMSPPAGDQRCRGRGSVARQEGRVPGVLSAGRGVAGTRCSQVGSLGTHRVFPNSIREYLQENNYGAAIETVDPWEDQFATEKVKGHTFFWRGLALSLRGQHREGPASSWTWR
ncbi:MAG: hypothetical protein Ct9H300mP1_16750 [Planctomycetaceae bacterium]|nr:MAG: hypothetical protein Ct9H300mP1_16750 [Planctomycetaceae bacterium]